MLERTIVGPNVYSIEKSSTANIALFYIRIWEKKYGKNANHVQKQAAENARAKPSAKGLRNSREARDNGKPFGKPQHGSRSIRPQSQQMQGQDSGWQQWPSQSQRPLTKEDKPLHPSWEAKKKLKEKQSVGIVPAQGKKIVF